MKGMVRRPPFVDLGAWSWDGVVSSRFVCRVFTLLLCIVADSSMDGPLDFGSLTREEEEEAKAVERERERGKKKMGFLGVVDIPI